MGQLTGGGYESDTSTSLGFTDEELLLMLVKSKITSGAGWIVGAGLVFAVGCTPEPYGPCTLPSNNVIQEACGNSGESTGEGGVATSNSASCVVDFVFECESRLCGTFEGSTPFCTQRCNGEDDTTTCPQGGECVEFVPTTDLFYCVTPDIPL